MSQSANCCSRKDTRLLVLRAHAPSCEPVVEKPSMHQNCPGSFTRSHHTLSRPVSQRLSTALVHRQARPPTPQTCRLGTCVRSRRLLVREVGEFVQTRLEREGPPWGVRVAAAAAATAVVATCSTMSRVFSLRCLVCLSPFLLSHFSPSPSPFPASSAALLAARQTPRLPLA